jgi:hypothetical protein
MVILFALIRAIGAFAANFFVPAIFALLSLLTVIVVVIIAIAAFVVACL